MKKRRSRFIRARVALTDEQMWDLLLGPDEKSPFKSEQERRQAWFANRDELLAGMQYPYAYIEYERGGFSEEDGGRIRFWLERHGLWESFSRSK